MTSPRAQRVAVAGGTGVVGRHVVDALRARGHEPVVLARSTGVDVLSGRGVDDALSGADAVVDVTNRETLSRRKAHAFFETATRTLLDAGRRAGVQRHVVLSIVGVDLVPSGYYSAKLAQERLVLAEPTGLVLRATQFHEFADMVLERGKVGPVRVVPRMRMQPVAAQEVGELIAELAVDGTPGTTVELAGPQVHELVDLARRVAGVRGLRGRIVPVRPPGAAGRTMSTGSLLPGARARLSTKTFDEWLAAPTH